MSPYFRSKHFCAKRNHWREQRFVSSPLILTKRAHDPSYLMNWRGKTTALTENKIDFTKSTIHTRAAIIDAKHTFASVAEAQGKWEDTSTKAPGRSPILRFQTRIKVRVEEVQ